MMIGDTLHGFRVIRQVELDELSGTLHEMEHEKTGAKLAWLQRAEQNKTFMAAFQTIPEDDTGVFHILEHSVLCGSEKFPLKEPFVELMQGSMKTFLNAMTYPDKTVYPVSSRNDKDFMNLVRVYADAVMSPAIYRQPNIFRQEGWHYEVKEGAEPSYKGVVFNEMKGAFSSVDTILQGGMNRLLYPESCYRFVSGGDPEHIPELSYEQFLNAHRRFYHPSNALFFLDGDLDLAEVLELLDEEYLSKYERQERDFAIHMQQPVSGAEGTVSYQLAPGQKAEGKTHFCMGKLAGTWADKEKCLALKILCSYLAGSNDAPLKKAILRRGLGQDLFMSVSDGNAQPSLVLQVRNTQREKCGEIRAVLRETAQELLEQGLDRGELEAIFNRMEFSALEHSEPYGLTLGLGVTASWLCGGQPELYLTWGDTFAALREKMEDGYMESLLREILADQEHTAVLYALPSATLGQETMEREAQRLQNAKASWDRGDPGPSHRRAGGAGGLAAVRGHPRDHRHAAHAAPGGHLP